MAYRTIKSEVRILGIDSCSKRRTVGVVVRGGHYLDGVLDFGRKPGSAALARDIQESKYFPELRFIMAHRKNNEPFDSDAIESTTRLPVIEVTSTRLPVDKKRQYLRIAQAGKTVHVKSKLAPTTVTRLLSLSWTIGDYPEPVRIAHLIGKTNIPKDFRTIKDKNAPQP